MTGPGPSIRDTRRPSALKYLRGLVRAAGSDESAIETEGYSQDAAARFEVRDDFAFQGLEYQPGIFR